jgi:hypothetical protein
MFEQTFKNIDDILHKDAGCTSELDYTEQSSWLLFLKYLDALEADKALEAELDGKTYSFIIDKPYRWESWATPKGADGKPMSAAQFLETLYGVLPEFFKDEDELRTLWSSPDTRKALLAGLTEKGFSKVPLLEMQRAIEAENSDLFDVLAYVAFAAAPETRAQRADQARAEAHQQFNDRQQAFIDFVLSQYVTQGVEELDADKLTPLLRLKYNNAISDAVADLGGTTQIRTMFAGFQKYLYLDNEGAGYEI